MNPTTAKGKKWWNNGKIERLSLEKPNMSFRRGRLPKESLKRNPRDKKWHYNILTGEEIYCKVPPSGDWKRGKPSISNIQMGKKKPNTSKSLKGKPKSEEHKRKLSENKIKNRYKMIGDNNPMSNPDHRKRHQEVCSSAEHRKRISEGVRKNRWTKEHREKQSEWAKKNSFFCLNKPTSKKLEIYGKIYNNIQEAMNDLNKSRKFIKENATFL